MVDGKPLIVRFVADVFVDSNELTARHILTNHPVHLLLGQFVVVSGLRSGNETGQQQRAEQENAFFHGLVEEIEVRF